MPRSRLPELNTSPYLWKINSTCRVSQRLQKWHWGFAPRFVPCQRSRFVFDAELRGSHVHTILRLRLANGNQLVCIRSSNYLALRFVITSGSLLLHPSPQFPAFKNVSFAQKGIESARISHFQILCYFSVRRFLKVKTKLTYPTSSLNNIDASCFTNTEHRAQRGVLCPLHDTTWGRERK